MAESSYFNIHDLPEEIVMLIFSFLEFDDLARCSQVCAYWNRISKCGNLRKSINLAHRQLSPSSLRQLVSLHCTPTLRDARFRKISKMHYGSIRTVLSTAKNLERLDLIGSFITTPETGAALNGIFPKKSYVLSHLVHLSLRGSLCGMHPFFRKSQRSVLPSLRCLDLGQSLHIYSRDFSGISVFTSLRTLYLDGILFKALCVLETEDPSSLNDLIWRIPSFAYLQVLDFEGIPMDNDAFEEILKNFSNLKKLYVGHTLITGKSILGTGKMTATLNELCIRHTEVSFYAIFSFLSEVYKGKIFTLHCSFPDSWVEELKMNKNWVVVNLQHSEKDKCNHYKHHLCI